MIDNEMARSPGPHEFVTYRDRCINPTFAEMQGYAVYVECPNAILKLWDVSNFEHGAWLIVSAVGTGIVYVRPSPNDRIRLNGVSLSTGNTIGTDGTAGRSVLLHKDGADGWTALHGTGWSDQGTVTTTSTTSSTSTTSTTTSTRSTTSSSTTSSSTSSTSSTSSSTTTTSSTTSSTTSTTTSSTEG